MERGALWVSFSLHHYFRDSCHDYGPRPLNSTRRHGPILGLVTCDMAF